MMIDVMTVRMHTHSGHCTVLPRHTKASLIIKFLANQKELCIETYRGYKILPREAGYEVTSRYVEVMKV